MNIFKYCLIIFFLVGCANDSNFINNEESENIINNRQEEFDYSNQDTTTIVTNTGDYYDSFKTKFEELIDNEYSECFSRVRYGWTGYQIQIDLYSLIDVSDTDFNEVCQNISDDINEIINIIDYSPTGWIKNDVLIVISFYVNDCYKTYTHEIDNGCFKHYDWLRIRIEGK